MCAGPFGGWLAPEPGELALCEVPRGLRPSGKHRLGVEQVARGGDPQVPERYDEMSE